MNPISNDYTTITVVINVHISPLSDSLLTFGLEKQKAGRSRDDAYFIGSTQCKLGVKHLHPFCLKNVELSEPLTFYQLCIYTSHSYTTNLTNHFDQCLHLIPRQKVNNDTVFEAIVLEYDKYETPPGPRSCHKYLEL